jgi:Flp pilus assembly protein TadG
MSICNTAKNTALKVSGRLRQERGQSLVEFAVVLPVLILIILGILYFGRYEDYANQETQLAEEGVRWAAVDNNPSTSGQTLQQYIISQASAELGNGSTDVTSPAQVWIYQPTSATGYASGQPIRVCVIATVIFPSPIGQPSTTIAQMATMRIEQVPTSGTNPWTSGNPTGTMPSQCLTS